MLGNFTYYNPTKLYFGGGSVASLRDELPKYGPNIVLVYGGGSHQSATASMTPVTGHSGPGLRQNTWRRSPASCPTPPCPSCPGGHWRSLRRRHQADFLLAVGGGSVCDYTKAVAASVHCEEDPWQKYFVRFEEPACPVVPLGCVLTMVGTGSEMNAGSGHHEPRHQGEGGQGL